MERNEARSEIAARNCPAGLRGTLRVACVLALLLAAGCNRVEEGQVSNAPVAPPAATANTPQNPPGGPAVVKEEPITDFAQLPTRDGAEFEVRAEKRSMKVVEHYDRELARRGWKKLTPKSEDEVGQRKWVSTGMDQGPTDGLQAAWRHSNTGETAVLSLSHFAEEPGVQRGIFEVYDKGEAP